MNGYNLNEPLNKGVKDKPAEWMREILDIEITKENPFENVDNFLINSSKENQTCENCGILLKEHEILHCSKCLDV